MFDRHSLLSALFVGPVLLCGCSPESDRQIPVSSLSASDHKEVMDLVKHIYEDGIGEHIVAWYETTARGYFDIATGKHVSFDVPIRTLSVAIPDFVAHTTNVLAELEGVTKRASYNAWRLVEYRVELLPHGAGNYDKVTIYPITVAKAGRTIDRSGGQPMKDRPSNTALLNATRQGDLATMRKLLSAGADPNGQVDGDTPLVVAATRRDSEPVSLLLESGADVDRPDAIGTAPLFAATLNGNEQVVAILIANGAEVDAKLPNGVTAIDMAELKGYANIVKLLREAKRKWSPDGRTVYRSALSIVSYTSDVTPLHQAGLEGRVDEAKRLVAQGADIEAKTNDGTTPIHSATVAGHPDVVAFLIAKHAKVDAADNDGRTPLHSAAMKGHVSVAKLLIAAGADVNRRIQLGKATLTPLGLARLLGQQEMEVVLAAQSDRLVSCTATPTEVELKRQSARKPNWQQDQVGYEGNVFRSVVRILDKRHLPELPRQYIQGNWWVMGGRSRIRISASFEMSSSMRTRGAATISKPTQLS